MSDYYKIQIEWFRNKDLLKIPPNFKIARGIFNI